VPHFRGCSGELNLGPRAYHSGDFEEIGWVLQRLAAAPCGPVLAVGVSLGGNALMRWAGEMGERRRRWCGRGVGLLADRPGGRRPGDRPGFNRLVYTRMFLRTMVPKALQKLQQHPGLFDRDRLLRARDLYEFDNIFTAPLHGFRDTDDYWARASAKPHLHRIRVPALVVNARTTRLCRRWSLPRGHEVAPHVTLWQPAHGGHVGFPQGPPAGPCAGHAGGRGTLAGASRAGRRLGDGVAAFGAAGVLRAQQPLPGGQATSAALRGLPMGAAAWPLRTAAMSSSLGYWPSSQ
jgi:predicted alpha/beta-fold hydrolase